MSREKEKIVLGTGIKVWGIICIISNISVAIINLSLENMDVGVIVSLAFSVLYAWLLLGKRRFAFYLIVAAAFVGFLINAAVYRVNFLFAIAGLANPAIAFAFLSKDWGKMR